MKKNNEHEEEAEAKNERWLLTYSDMITLLLALFIILYSMSNIEAKKFAKMAEGFSNAFNSDSNTTNSGNGNGTENGPGTGTNNQTGNENIPNISNIDPLDEIYNILSDYIDQNNLEEEISLINSDSFVQIRLKGMMMFVPDSPQLLESSKHVIKEISEVLKTVYDKVDHITISGNTADTGEHNEQTNEFSWYLSVNRADTVRKSLVEYGLHDDKISLEGYGHNNPVASNKTEEGRAQNRRAEITVYKYPPKK